MRYLLTILFIFGAGLANAQSTVIFPLDTTTPAKSVVVRIVDATDGTPETGVTTSDTPAFYYQEWGANANSSNFYTGDHAALTDAWDEGEIYHIGSGYYRVDIPDALSDSEGTYTIHGSITDMVVIGCTVQITQALTVDSNGRAKTDVESISGATAPADNLETAFGNTLAEVSGVPSATDPLWEKVGFLFQALTAGYENTTSNGGEKRYKNAAGTVQWEKDLTDNGTTYTESAAGTPD